MILAAGVSPAWQQIACVDAFRRGEVNRAREVHWCASGKVLNVGLALHHLGADATTLSFVGGLTGQAIREEFAKSGIRARWVETAAPTRVCTTILDRDMNVATELVEEQAPVTSAELDAFASAFAQEAARAEFVVLTGSLPTGAKHAFYRRLMERVRGRAVLDIRGQGLVDCLPLNPLVVKPNREELEQTVGRPLSDDASLLPAMRELSRAGAEWVVISDGAKAVWAASKDEAFRFEPLKVAVVNPIGCGDCLAAGIAWGLTDGCTMPEAIRRGIASAAANLRQLLPARISAEHVRRAAPDVISVTMR